MRVLTKKQKKILDEWVENDSSLHFADKLSLEQWDILENINDTEILWQEVNRYLLDKHSKVIFKI